MAKTKTIVKQSTTSEPRTYFIEYKYLKWGGIVLVIIIVGIFSSYYLGNAQQCSPELENAITNGIYSAVDKQTYSWQTLGDQLSLFGIPSGNGYTFENNFYFECDRGSTQGQNANYFYCHSASGQSTSYVYDPVRVTSTDSNGNIVQNFKIDVDVVIDSTRSSGYHNYTVTDVICKRRIW